MAGKFEMPKSGALLPREQARTAFARRVISCWRQSRCQHQALSLMVRLITSERRSFRTGLRVLPLRRTGALSSGIFFFHLAGFFIYTEKSTP